MSRAGRNTLPGFRLAMGFTLLYLGLMVLLPLAALAAKAAGLSGAEFWKIATEPRVLAAYRLSFGAAFTAAAINAVFGFVVAWVLSRYQFPGRGLLDGLVDLPFALPTAVAGIALTAAWAPDGLLGAPFAALGLPAVFSPTGVTIALTFISLPFVVRTVQPVLMDLDADVEEAAAILGASRAQTLWRVVLPSVLPALLTGFALAFARALGEYGSVIFIAGNLPMKTEIVPLLIMTKLEQFDVAGATALAVVMLAASFAMLLSINLLQAWSRRR